ncbi:MAG TPA: TetR/AcrR family transcriptional regulator [Ktedonobacterales bacterium]
MSKSEPDHGTPLERRRTLDLLWGKRAGPTRGPKPSLNVEKIVAAAVAIADSEGLEAVSMQRVAEACGVTTMALYRYVPGKSELVALMLDVGLGAPPPLAGAPGDWRAQLEDWARRLWVIFQAHPWSLAATAPARVMGPNELGWFEVAVSVLGGTSLSAEEAVQAVIAILLHVRGMAGAMLGGSADRGQNVSGGWSAMVAELLRAHGESFPALRAASFDPPASEAPDGGPGGGLGFGLRLLLDGLSAHIGGRARSTSSAKRPRAAE